MITSRGGLFGVSEEQVSKNTGIRIVNTELLEDGSILVTKEKTVTNVYTFTEHYWPGRKARKGLFNLTPREEDVLELIAKGYKNRQAGEELGISVRTVESHRANIMSKLELKEPLELVQYWKEHYENRNNP